MLHANRLQRPVSAARDHSPGPLVRTVVILFLVLLLGCAGDSQTGTGALSGTVTVPGAQSGIQMIHVLIHILIH